MFKRLLGLMLILGTWGFILAQDGSITIQPHKNFTSEGKVTTFDFTTNDWLLAAVVNDTEGRPILSIRDWNTGDVKHRVTISNSVHLGIEGLRFSPDGTRIAIATGQDREIGIWNAATGALMEKVKTKGPTLRLDWHPTGEMLAVTVKEYVEIWKVKPLKKKKQIRGAITPSAGLTTSVKWSADGRYLAMGTNEPAVYIHNYRTKKTSGMLLPRVKGFVETVAWNASDDMIAAAGYGKEGPIHVWKNPKSAADEPYERLYQLTSIFDPRTGQSWGKMTWDPKGEIVAFGDNRGQFYFWDIPTGMLLHKFTPHPEGMARMAVWRGHLMITLDQNNMFRVWTMEINKAGAAGP